MKIYTQKEMEKKFKKIVLKEYLEKMEKSPHCHHHKTNDLGYTDKSNLDKEIFYYSEHFCFIDSGFKRKILRKLKRVKGWHEATITFIEHNNSAILRDGTKVVCAWGVSEYFHEDANGDTGISTYTGKRKVRK